MSNERLHGYSVDDDDPHDDEPQLSSSQSQPLTTAESETATVTVAHTGDGTTLQQQEQQEPQSTTSTPTTPTLPDRPSATDEFADPKIALLHAIFPDFDAAILYSVVDSVNGDQDRAVDALLAMNDPNHVSASSPAGGPTTQIEPSLVEQTQLDEEFARQLMLEDEQRYARDQIALRQQQQQQSRQQFPYATRVTPQQASSVNATINNNGAAEQQNTPQRDTMTDVQEQFSKLAETGKRTFSSFVSKVKAKVQEFDHSRNAQQQQQQQNSSSVDATGPTTTAITTSPGGSSEGSLQLDRHAQQAYYAPRVNPNSPATAATGYAVHGDDDDDERAPPRAATAASSLPPSAPAVVNDDSTTQPPPMTRSGPPPSNIDPGKIGLLPKRPVSLVNTQSQPRSRVDDDDEELEYVENPFEEGRYS